MSSYETGSKFARVGDQKTVRFDTLHLNACMSRTPLDAHFDAAYAELLRIAERHFSHAAATLDTVALVSEAYLKLHRHDLFRWESGQHVRSVACSAMRQVVCNYLRGKQQDKRRGERVALTLDRLAEPALLGPADLLDLDAAMTRLGSLNERQLRVVEMRFFGGYTFDEIAEALGVSVSTVQRDWTMAALFLRCALGDARHAHGMAA